ncbi:acyltransferase family protein [Caulobacter mirabilis]|uniref:Acyltransferase n=1 Tax=Caulobacter mirabilis TaxID=69666 RepID=A0A2D2B0S6_9CAUL|nr:acyltransferase [Caulobacter mirabilis]ATQ43858.1 acyltransferase [Caulobacter mirabilis]
MRSDPNATQPSDLPALTTIRFVLAAGVVLFHYQLQWPWDTLSATGLIERARLGVDIFFILSGFVLTHAYRAALAEGRFHYGRFMAARFARIYPAHLAVLAFVLAMVIVAVLIGAEFDDRNFTGIGLGATLLLVHAWFPAVYDADWNGPSWSLSAEWFAYLAFPAYAWIGLKLRDRPWLVLGLAAGLFAGCDLAYQQLFGQTVVHAENNMGVLRILPEFLYGVGLYRLFERLKPSRPVAIAAALGLSMLMLALMHVRADDRLIVVIAGPFVLALALLAKAGADKGLARPWMLLGGEASYALYLIHMPILIGWKGVNALLTDRPSDYVLAVWEIPLLLAISLLAAVALHRHIEAPARVYLRRQANRLWPTTAKTPMSPGSQPPDV